MLRFLEAPSKYWAWILEEEPNTFLGVGRRDQLKCEGMDESWDDKEKWSNLQKSRKMKKGGGTAK